MTLAEGIRTAVEYETRVRDTYRKAAERSSSEVGKRVFRILAKEEEGHIQYLKSKRAEWTNTGRITAGQLETVVPSRQVIDGGIRKLERHLPIAAPETETALLEKALKVEIETSNFYRRMVDEIPLEKEIFSRFLEIEKGHQILVQAELDYLKNTGFYFDFQEFSLEH